MGKITLVTGGARCGKSDYSLTCAGPYKKRAFIATATACDSEMETRIANHQIQRGDLFETIEAPYDLPAALKNVPDSTDFVIVDCLTVWLGNLFYKYEKHPVKIDQCIGELITQLTHLRFDLILVTNEVGWGIIPDNSLSRRFRDCAGRLNSQVATVADAVILMVCGQPFFVKPRQSGSE